MLTIFEYLRKRARESIVAGVHDAVELLDKKNAGADQSAGSVEVAAQNPTTTPQQPPYDPQKYLEFPAGGNNSDMPALPPPRKRGRPRKQGGAP